MIIRLVPEQVAEYWDIIKHCACQTNNISEALAPEYCNNLFQQLLLERYQVWAGIATEDGQKKFIGMLITALIKNDLSGGNSLLMYGIYAYRLIDDNMLREGLSAIKQFAKAENCDNIFGFTNNERLLKFLGENGFITDIKRFSLEV